MLTFPLSSGLYFTKTLDPLSKFADKTVSACLVSGKIKAIATVIFKGCTSTYLCVFGALELGQNIKKNDFPDKMITTQAKVIESSSTYLNLHGSLLLSSGIFGLLDALQGFGLVNFRNFAQAISAASATLFLCVNIIGLDENVRLLNELIRTDWSKTNINDQELRWIKQSAFWGLLSNLGYIVMTTSLLFNGATALAILLAAFSCCAGGVKILFDILLWAKNDNLC